MKDKGRGITAAVIGSLPQAQQQFGRDVFLNILVFSGMGA
jgi:hypothetical protein